MPSPRFYFLFHYMKPAHKLEQKYEIIENHLQSFHKYSIIIFNSEFRKEG